ncbi:5-bromo-4-chloroindolyl phosphate hydrolysis protein [Anoxybacillus calidus]|jgi:5-bromo-4-chloroindolyl phosphate hydrolysis protein|uniref:5-bromo-4-chloroindolyl phosphate hydrolysis protein n=1 Tax=[Anoxybacillus] calidus TaxID=575178 RepID=A0A7W0BU91_9BACL|nr:5-bromo-4-chloroindolyl phosphate hydrolysis family protein [Anoxybacillus calidus]MBA2870310.1 5-bromo-4-chloroindolyl phosphate hydrolysis protein [Anoxybacillus calidus]
MRKVLRTLWRLFVSWNIGLIGAIIVFFVFDYQFFLSFLSGTALMVITSAYMKRKADKVVTSDLLKEEKDYIRSELKEADKKIKRIGRARFKVRSLVTWNQISRIYAASQKILAAVEQDPRRFRAAQSFFITTLDSAVTMIEKYIYLVRQPVRSQEMNEAIRNAEGLLGELAASTEQELLRILSDDVFDLDVEIKMLKQALEQPKEQNVFHWQRDKEERYERIR